MVFSRKLRNIVAIAFLCFFAWPLPCFADGEYVNSIPAPKDPVQAAADGPTNNGDAFCKLGFEALTAREPDRAIKFFDDAIRYDPKNANAYGGRGLARLIKGKKGEDPKTVYPEVLKDANEAVRLDPSSVSGWRLRAQALYELGRIDEAIVACEKAIAINPHASGAYAGRAAAYKAKGDYDSAISDFSKAIALADGEWDLKWALSERAGVYVEKGDLVRAEVDCDRAMQVDPAFYVTYKVRARIFAARKEYDRAWADVRKAQELGGKVRPAFLEELEKNAPSL